jgi:hypothetical protein
MNLMTDKEISPAACAVLDAAFNASTWGRDDCLNDAREIAAAVLRAAVAHTQQRQYNECWICDANELLAIAAELETV